MTESPPPVQLGTDLGAAFEAASDIASFLQLWLSVDFLTGASAAAFEAYYGGYRRAFPERMQRAYAGQIAEAEKIVRLNPGLRVLEIGCGLGTESLWLAMHGAKVMGVDLRSDRLAAAEERRRFLEDQLGRPVPCRFRIDSLLDLPEKPKFDLVWMEQTFHHLEPRSRMVAKAARLLAPGGHIVISEANAWNAPLQLQLLLRRGWPRVKTMTGPGGRKHAYGDERITTAGALRRAFARCGVNSVSVRYFRMFPNHAFFDRLAAIERAPALIRLAPLFTHFNYVGIRDAGERGHE